MGYCKPIWPISVFLKKLVMQFSYYYCGTLTTRKKSGTESFTTLFLRQNFQGQTWPTFGLSRFCFMKRASSLFIIFMNNCAFDISKESENVWRKFLRKFDFGQNFKNSGPFGPFWGHPAFFLTNPCQHLF